MLDRCIPQHAHCGHPHCPRECVTVADFGAGEVYA